VDGPSTGLAKLRRAMVRHVDQFVRAFDLAQLPARHYPMLKNSNFCVDHSSEDRWQAQWKIP
jgi:hypothetical protein